MQLSLRLSAIAGLVTRGNRLVDVGCDHGYLPVSLYLDGKIPGAIAMDVRKGPLSRAQEHISQYGLDAYIETRLERELPFDYGFVCLGMRAQGQLFAELSDAFVSDDVEILNIGDSKRARRIIDGTLEGRNILNTLTQMGYLQ